MIERDAVDKAIQKSLDDEQQSWFFRGKALIENYHTILTHGFKGFSGDQWKNWLVGKESNYFSNPDRARNEQEPKFRDALSNDPHLVDMLNRCAKLRSQNLGFKLLSEIEDIGVIDHAHTNYSFYVNRFLNMTFLEHLTTVSAITQLDRLKKLLGKKDIKSPLRANWQIRDFVNNRLAERDLLTKSEFFKASIAYNLK